MHAIVDIRKGLELINTPISRASVSVTAGARVGDLDAEVSKDAMSEADGILGQRRVRV